MKTLLKSKQLKTNRTANASGFTTFDDLIKILDHIGNKPEAEADAYLDNLLRQTKNTEDCTQCKH